ncbi:MAG: ABC transporter ATP-binding protein [Chloroflexi bacterium]|nr:ABC transporter ATP-binding protein [Chloroflexota bacterium]
MIETHGLTKHFGDFVAVQDVSLTVPPGTLLALLGPNGAGKTTTIRMLTSILKPTTGSAIVAGFDVVKEAPQVRASVGVLTEQHGLYERMNGLEYLDFFGRIYRIPEEVRQRRSRMLMERFGLGDAMEGRIATYSKGMKQKIALVRALLHDPPVLLLDEPTSAMDPQSARLVRDAIRDLKRDQRTIVLTTHNLAEAESLADEIAIIRHGRVIAKGTQENLARRVVGNPQFEIRTATPLNGTVESISKFVKPLRVEDYCVQYESTDPDKDNPRVVKEMVGAGVDVVTVSKISRTLEDVYLGIVEEDEK